MEVTAKCPIHDDCRIHIDKLPNGRGVSEHRSTLEGCANATGGRVRELVRRSRERAQKPAGGEADGTGWLDLEMGGRGDGGVKGEKGEGFPGKS